MRIWPTSVAASAAETAFSSRSIESSARIASLLLNCSLCAQRLRTSRNSLTMLRSAWPSVFSEDGVPLVPQHAQQNLRVVEIGGLWPWHVGRARGVRQGGLPVVAEMRLQFAFDKRAQAGGQQVQPFAHTFTVRYGHSSAVHH